MIARTPICTLLVSAALAVPLQALAGPPVEIRLGTVAPPKSPWYRMLEDMRQEWARVSGGRVVLRILSPVGSERSLIDKMWVQTLHAVAVSGVGLPALDRGISALHTPLLFRSYEELDYVRDRLAPTLEASLAKKGVVALNWSDVGWVYFFSRTPIRTPSELRPLRIYTTAGDADTETLFKAAGFRPQPLEASDLLSGLQTGMVDAFDVPPLFALLNQSFALAPHMLDLRWAVLTGATIIDARAWARVPPELHRPLLDASRQSAARYRAQIRKLGDDAVIEMQRQKLQLHAVDEPALEEWRRQVEQVHPQIRGTLAPADLFDEALRLVAEYRQAATR
jgi:TRAP-type C4-dicarboxylate transport system substrate-binding protein